MSVMGGSCLVENGGLVHVCLFVCICLHSPLSSAVSSCLTVPVTIFAFLCLSS